MLQYGAQYAPDSCTSHLSPLTWLHIIIPQGIRNFLPDSQTSQAFEYADGSRQFPLERAEIGPLVELALATAVARSSILIVERICHSDVCKFVFW